MVRGCFAIVPGEAAIEAEGDFEGDLSAHGKLSSELYRDDDDERNGTCLHPDDFADYKLNAEVMVRGNCHAPGNQPTRQLPVSISVGEWSKTLQVTGPRVWSDSQSGAVVSDTIAFTKVALCYDNAFGGPNYPRNPVGKGHEDNQLPLIEDPRDAIRTRSDRPAEPAGFGPINSNWPQRRNKVGTAYGDDYQKTRAPFYAADFDWTYFQSAPDDQQLDGYLRGDEQLRFVTLHPDHPVLSCRLPGLRVRVFVKNNKGELAELAMRLDTLVADVDDDRLYLSWRGLGKVAEDDLMDVATVLIASEPLAEPRDAAHYHAQLEAFENDPLGLEEHGAAELIAQRDAGLAQLAETQDALAQLGANGDEGLADDMGRIMDLAGSDPAQKEQAQKAVTDALAAQKSQLPNAPQPALEISAAMKSAPAGSPPPYVIPKAGEPLPIPPDASLAAAIDKAREDTAKAADSMLEQLSQLEEAQREKFALDEVDPKKQLDDGLSILDDPLFARLRPKPLGQLLPGQDLSCQDLRDRDLSGLDLSGCNLRETILTRSDLRGTKLKGAVLAHAVLYQANLADADLSDADLTLANLSEANAKGARLCGAKLDTTFFDDACLANADLSRCHGKQPLFRRTDLSGATMAEIDLFEAIFEAAILKESNFRGAKLSGCLLLKCNAAKASFEDARLGGSCLYESQAPKANFVGVSGKQVVFLKMKLNDADFGWAVLPNAFFSEASAKRARFWGANLIEARFYRSVLDRADFSHANLFRADLRKSVLHHARMTDANLYEASLMQAFGENCDFEGANLTRCHLPKS